MVCTPVDVGMASGGHDMLSTPQVPPGMTYMMTMTSLSLGEDAKSLSYGMG